MEGSKRNKVCRATGAGKPAQRPASIEGCEIAFNLHGIGVEKRFSVETNAGY